jgi:hypothetical protein
MRLFRSSTLGLGALVAIAVTPAFADVVCTSNWNGAGSSSLTWRDGVGMINYVFNGTDFTSKKTWQKELGWGNANNGTSFSLSRKPKRGVDVDATRSVNGQIVNTGTFHCT